MSYAWIIDKDHLAVEELKHSGKAEDSAVGVIGPSDAPDWMCDRLQRPRDHRANLAAPEHKVFTFRMYDDDGELYYTGRMITDEGDTEEARYGPLGDFGMPNAGCTYIKYHGHPEMDCG